MTLMPLKLVPKLRGGTSLWIGGGLVALAVFVAVAAPLIARTDPVMDANLMNAEIPPGWEFPFGTDAQGRDIYSRIVYGARISLTVGIGSQILNSLIGVSLGLTAGYWGGWWDDFVNGLTNLMLAIPSLIFALAIMAVLGPGLTSLLIALGLTNWSFTCRIARASTLSLKSQGYVQAAQVLDGFGDGQRRALQQELAGQRRTVEGSQGQDVSHHLFLPPACDSRTLRRGGPRFARVGR